jgi:nitroreductase
MNLNGCSDVIEVNNAASVPTTVSTVQHTRIPTYKIDPIFVNNWSPRSMSGEELSDDDLMSLFEAARWAPSSFNNQLWRFIFAKRNTEHWTKFLNLLYEGNRVWAQDAAAFVVVISRNTFEYNGRSPHNTSV